MSERGPAAIGEGRILRTESVGLSKNLLNVALSGLLRWRDLVWPSAFRGVGAMPSVHLDMREDLKPIEENGFVIADLTPDKIVLHHFRWSAHRDWLADALERFRFMDLKPAE
jgi:hypothetical protein